MSKAILVMEMPENCVSCPCGDSCGEICQVDGREVGTYEDGWVDGQHEKPEWCPLVSMPERKDYDSLPKQNSVRDWAHGWNTCINAIEGGRIHEENR